MNVNPFRWFSKNRDHLWRNPLTGQYFDPIVLHAALVGTPHPTTADLRPLLNMRATVDLRGDGFAETQVRDAYLDFLAYLEKKGLTAADSPTGVTPTGAPAD